MIERFTCRGAGGYIPRLRPSSRHDERIHDCARLTELWKQPYSAHFRPASDLSGDMNRFEARKIRMETAKSRKTPYSIIWGQVGRTSKHQTPYYVWG